MGIEDEKKHEDREAKYEEIARLKEEIITKLENSSGNFYPSLDAEIRDLKSILDSIPDY